MKINLNNDIKSREEIKKKKNENKTDNKSSKKISKGNKGGQTERNKQDVPLLPDKTGVYAPVRSADSVQSDNAK